MTRSKISRITLLVALSANFLLVALYLLSAYVGYASPFVTGYLTLSGLAYPVFLLLLLLTIPLWLMVKRRYALINIAVIMVTLPQFLAFFPMNLHFGYDEPADSGTFKVMTYNVFNFQNNDTANKGRIHPTLTELLKYDADFICIQETADLRLLARNEQDNTQYKLLLKRYPYTLINDRTSLGYLSKQPTTLLRTLKGSRYFSAEIYRTTLGGDTTLLLNTHLESIGLTESDKQLYMELTSVNDNDKTLHGVRSQLMDKLTKAFRNRSKQAAQIATALDSLRHEFPGKSIIVCGDFNDTPYSYAYLTVKGDMHDAYTDAAFGPTYTYNQNRFYFKIDHLLYEGNIEAVNTVRGSARSSDHYPIISTFKTRTQHQ